MTTAHSSVTATDTMSPSAPLVHEVIAEMHKFLYKPTDYPLYETCALMRRALEALENHTSGAQNVQS